MSHGEVPAPATADDGSRVRAAVPGPAGRRVPAWAAALLLGISGAVLVLIALLAGRAGPLVAHPPTAPPAPPPTRSQPMITMPTLPSAPPPQQQAEPSGAWLWWVLAVIGGLILIFLVVALVRMLRRPGRIAAPPIASPAVALSPMEFGWLDEEPEVDLSDDRTFDPHRAADDIIASWTATESAATRLGLARRPSSTPTEFLAGLAERFGDPAMPAAPATEGAEPDRPRAAATLLSLYHHARFDTGALAPGAARSARRAALTLITAWGALPPRGRAARSGADGPDGAA